MKRLTSLLPLNLPLVALVLSGAALALAVPGFRSDETVQNRSSNVQSDSARESSLPSHKLFNADTEPAATTSPAASHTAAPEHSANSVFTRPAAPPTQLPTPPTPIDSTPAPPPVIVEPSEPEYPYNHLPTDPNPCGSCTQSSTYKSGPQVMCPMQMACMY
jgi:hypothetical protein